MTESPEKSLEMLTTQEVEENRRREERKRRNRESAAKCRQKLKDRLNTCQRVFTEEEYRNKALKNEISLNNIEFKKIMVVLKQHSNHCGLPNTFQYKHIVQNGVNPYNGIIATTASASDINKNHKKD